MSDIGNTSEQYSVLFPLLLFASHIIDSNHYLCSDTWLNDGLLAEIEKDPVISSKIGNPQFMAAFGEFQQNPAGKNCGKIPRVRYW